MRGLRQTISAGEADWLIKLTQGDIMSFIQSQEEVKGSSPFQEFKFEEVGDKITFVFVGKNKRNSSEWGEFPVAEVVAFNPEAKSIDAAVESAELKSFVLTTVLNNQVDNGLIVPGEAYTVEFVMDKGDKYTDKKTGKQARAKAKHFKVVRLGVPTEAIQKLMALVPSAVVKSETVVEEPAPQADTPKPRV